MTDNPTPTEATEADIQAAIAMCARNEELPANHAPYDFLIEEIAQAMANTRQQEREACIKDCWEESNCGDAIDAIRHRGKHE